MTRMIDEAHAKGIKVIGATLTPYGGARYERPDGDETYKQVNDFIRHGGRFDGVIDFEKATQDPAHPDRYLPAYNERDHLHPNDAGTKAMADSIDLNLFKSELSTLQIHKDDFCHLPMDAREIYRVL